MRSPPSFGPHQRRDPGRLPRNHQPPATWRWLGERTGSAQPSDPLARDDKLAQVEAALFAADEPLPLRKLTQAARLTDGAETRRLIRKLQQLYDQDETSFQVEELAGGFQLLTRSQYHRWLANLRRSQHDLRLSAAARETLTIVAYRQPITRADVEAIRGVHCGETLRLLMEKNMIKILGRDDSLGRPVLYGTTKKFLQIFGLRNLNDLPQNPDLRPNAAKGEDPAGG